MEATVFIGAAIAGITQFIKLITPQVHGAVTIVVAVLVGVLVGVVDTSIGIVDISIADGLLIGLASAGVVAAVKR